MRRHTRAAGAALVMMVGSAAPAAALTCKEATAGEVTLAQVRRATAPFHSVAVAERAGYQLGYVEPFLLNGCIAHPTDGAMGYHWFDHDRIHDTVLDPLHPEAMVYAPTSDGRRRLAAVEWVVPVALWEAAGNTEPPELFGRQMTVLNPALGWYVLHAWVWLPNPSGTFENWNPRVDCS